MTSSNDHTDDGTKLAPDGNGPDNPDMTFETQAHYDRESHRNLTTEIIFAIADAADVAPVDIKDPRYTSVWISPRLKTGFSGQRSQVTHEIVRGVLRSDITSITSRLRVMGGLWCLNLQRTATDSVLPLVCVRGE
jgi:hypothetical protein